MKTRCGGVILLALGAVLWLATTGSAQTTIQIPPEELERSITRFDLSNMSQEQTMSIMGMMFKGMRGGTGELTPATESAAVASAAPEVVAPAPQTIAVFPQIPPAVAGNKQALGRWMMFQADLLQKIGGSYAQYGQELLGESSGQTPKLDAGKAKKK